MQPRLREPPDAERETQAGAVRASPNAGRTPAFWAEWARNLGVAALAGVFLAFVGAFGTDELPLLTRLGYWLPLMAAGAVAGHFVSLAVERFLRADTNPWLFEIVVSVTLAVPLTLIVWAYGALVFGERLNPAVLPPLFVAVLVISAAMTAIMILASRPGRVTHALPEGATPAPARFMERLPAKLKGAAIYAVSSEDHYLRLHTSKGSDLILMRLSDAIVELEGLEGAQTHRSWWVARDAVESSRRDGDKMILALKGGVEAPVSRPNVRPLRQAGWY